MVKIIRFDGIRSGSPRRVILGRFVSGYPWLQCGFRCGRCGRSHRPRGLPGFTAPHWAALRSTLRDVQPIARLADEEDAQPEPLSGKVGEPFHETAVLAVVG